MIHAYLFILNIREGNGGHGPNFIKIMTGINRTAGTNISVYHTFHDEVNLYKTHVWRCNGICQHRKPFYGWVKRTCNRAPGPNDIWWQRHHESCGGTFQKISQPEPKHKAKKSKKSIETKTAPKIPSWAQPNSIKAGTGFGTKMGGSFGSKTIVVKPPPKTQNIRTITANDPKPTSSYVPSSTAGSNLGNVIGFKDLSASSPGKSDFISQTGKASLIEVSITDQPREFPSGSGRPLNAGAGASKVPDLTPVAERLRNVWSHKFETPSVNVAAPLNQATETAAPPETESSNKRGYVEITPTQNWEDVDDDIMVWEEKHPIIDICDDDSSDSQNSSVETKPNIKHERSFQPDAIKRELIDDLGENDDVIELIDDEFDDAFNETVHILSDTSVINDIFGEDTLMADFNNINNVIMNDPENRGNPNREIITCPICQDKMRREELNSHLEGCTGITVKVELKPKSRDGIIVSGTPRQLPFYKNQTTARAPSTSRIARRVNSVDRDLLRQAGYTQEQIDRLGKETAEEKDYNARIMDEMAAEQRAGRTQPTNATAAAAVNNTVIVSPPATITSADAVATLPAEMLPCPVCNQMVNANEINLHLDECLNSE